MNINVAIERLVLDGIDVPYHQRSLLQAAVEGELARLLADGGLAPSLLAGGAHQLGGQKKYLFINMKQMLPRKKERSREVLQRHVVINGSLRDQKCHQFMMSAWLV